MKHLERFICEKIVSTLYHFTWCKAAIYILLEDKMDTAWNNVENDIPLYIYNSVDDANRGKRTLDARKWTIEDFAKLYAHCTDDFIDSLT